MKKPKFIKEIEKFEWKERAKCWRWYIRVYWELDHKPMVELESLEMVVKELHKLEEENKKLNEKYNWLWDIYTRDVNERIEENKKLREERDLYKARNEELNENCFWLAKENKKLKEENKKLQNDLETVSGAYFDR